MAFRRNGELITLDMYKEDLMGATVLVHFTVVRYPIQLTRDVVEDVFEAHMVKLRVLEKPLSPVSPCHLQSSYYDIVLDPSYPDVPIVASNRDQ